MTFDWLDDVSKAYLEIIGLSTSVQPHFKFFKSNLLNNNWLIVLISYIQYRTYKSEYYQKKLSPEAIEADAKEFGRKHPKWTKAFQFCQDLAYISVPWISFIIYICNAFLNSKTVINFLIYAYSLCLIVFYIQSNKDTSKTLRRLIIAWNFGIGLTITMFLCILVYQIMCLGPIANSTFIENLLEWTPEFIKMNSDLLGFENYNGSTQLQFSVMLLAYVLNFVFAIITKRHLSNQYQHLVVLESKQDYRFTMNRLHTHKYIKWLVKLKCLWPVFDFIARFMFSALGLFVIVFSIHWKLSVFNWLYIITMGAYYITISFSLIFKAESPNFEGYQNLNDDTMDVDEITKLRDCEDRIAENRILTQRKLFAMAIFL